MQKQTQKRSLLEMSQHYERVAWNYIELVVNITRVM